MQISCLEISIRYLKFLVKEITNIDNISKLVIVILVSCILDTKILQYNICKNNNNIDLNLIIINYRRKIL